MSNDDDRFHEASEPKSGMSSTSKALFIILGVFGVAVLLCCGGVVFFFSKSGFEQTHDPAEIAKVQESILQLEVAERFEASQAISVDTPVFKMTMTAYDSGDSQLITMLMQSSFGGVDPGQARQEMSKQTPSRSELENATTETKTYEIDGKEVSVTFAHGKLKAGKHVPADQAGKDWYTVQGMMGSGKGLVLFMLAGPEEEFDEAETDAMIRSMHVPGAGE